DQVGDVGVVLHHDDRADVAPRCRITGADHVGSIVACRVAGPGRREAGGDSRREPRGRLLA
ncbi:MAG: hypothetical protein ACR2HV_07040, partial [Acidimicrobiales bacterium]